jgi:protein-disulfide isomerase
LAKGRDKAYIAAVGLILLAGSAVVFGQAKKAARDPASPAISSEKIIRYVREKFGISDNVVLSVEPFKSSPAPGFLSSAIEVGEGKDKKTNAVAISKDGHTIVFGSLFALSGDTNQAIEQQIRTNMKLPATVSLTVGPFRVSKFPSLEETTVTANDGRSQQVQPFYVTKDRQFLVLGTVFDLDIPPRVQALRGLSLTNQASQGPASAPVTIVEFADLQCPTCARLHQLIEEDLVPKYGDKIRVIFKEFPLYQNKEHDWAVNGAVASQCVYEIHPVAFVNFRSLVFQHQGSVTGVNAREALIQYGEEAGVDGAKLAGCLDTHASLPRVEASLHEGQSLNVSSTPTCFINGRIVVGANPDDYYRAIDEALAARGLGTSRTGQAGQPPKTRKKSQ